jgi:hypothetical protein
VPAVTVKRLLPVALSPPVVTVTFDAPIEAPAAMVTVAVRCVASMTEMLLAVIPGLLNVTDDDPAAKCVNCPVICTALRV